MGQATSKDNEVKSKMKHPSNIPTSKLVIPFSGTVQSAYCKGHLRETVLLKVQWHCWGSWWRIPDSSEAFDVNDQLLLLKHLEFIFHIKENALSCTLPTKFSVSVVDKTTSDVPVQFGVPQGSLIGQKIYYMYTKPVGEII